MAGRCKRYQDLAARSKRKRKLTNVSEGWQMKELPGSGRRKKLADVRSAKI
jgi:hypothetical protein